MTTKSDLQSLVHVLNKVTGGGNYSLDYAYGRVRLTNFTGSKDVSPRLSRGELAEWIYAYMAGYEAALAPAGTLSQ